MQVNAALYCRISKDREKGKVGAGLGVERQETDCRALALKLGWQVADIYVDNDLSAYSGKPRPEYRRMLDDLRSDRVHAVVAWHTDRLHRSPVELEEFISVCEAAGAMVQTVKAGEVDLNTPSGRAVARTLGAWARHEVEHMIERQKSAKSQAAAAGRFRGGRRPFGFEQVGMTVRESEATVIRELADRVLAGESLRSLATELNGRGVTGSRGGPWTGASVRDVLVAGRNAGLIEHKGEVVGPALWAPVLDVDVWRAVRGLLTAPGRVRPKQGARRWLLSGLAVCGRGECGLPVRISSTRNPGSAITRFAYRCSGPTVHVSRAADLVDDMVRDAVLERLSRPDAVNLLRPKTPDVDLSAMRTEANGMRARLDELAKLFARGVVTAGQLTTGTTELRAALTETEARISSAIVASPLNGLVDAEDVGAVWASRSLDQKRAVIDTLLRITILPGKRGRKAGGIYFDPETVDLEWKSPA